MVKSGEKPAAISAGYNVETGQVAARASANRMCAETNVCNALGGDKGAVKFTEAWFPRKNVEKPVCLDCEARYGRSAFPTGTQFLKDLQ